MDVPAIGFENSPLVRKVRNRQLRISANQSAPELKEVRMKKVVLWLLVEDLAYKVSLPCLTNGLAEDGGSCSGRCEHDAGGDREVATRPDSRF
jgi:hypothetical protein